MKYLFAAIVFWMPIAYSAVSHNPKNDDMKAIAESVAHSKAEVSAVEKEKRKVLASLYHINQRVKKISKEKRSLGDQLYQAEENIRFLAKRIKLLDQLIDEQKGLLKKRLRFMYKLSGEGMLAILFGNADSGSLDLAIKYLAQIAQSDRELISEFQKNRIAHQHKRAELDSEVRRLIKIRQGIKDQELRLADEQNSKSKVIAELDRQTLSKMNLIRSLRQQTGRAPEKTSSLDNALSEMLVPSIFEHRGRLTPPVAGEIVREFGVTQDPQYRISISHKGWSIQAAAGSPVRSIYQGRVVYIGQLPGFGRTLVIDHGDHYYSVLARISAPQVTLGSVVGRGQVVAFVSSGNKARPYVDFQSDGLGIREGDHSVYFEIRHFSDPENPANWIQKENINVTIKELVPDAIAGSSLLESTKKNLN